MLKILKPLTLRSNMEHALKQEVKAEISRIVDLMIQVEAMREQIASLKKDIKDE